MVAVTFDTSVRRSGKEAEWPFAGPELVADLNKTSTFKVNGNRYVVYCLCDLADIKQLQKQWDRLLDEQVQPFTYYQSFDWVYCWAKEFAGSPGSELQIYAVITENTLVAVWPLAVNDPEAGVRVLTTLGDPLGQYSGIIAEPSKFDVNAGKALLAHIKENCGCDSISIPHCPDNSLLFEIAGDLGIIEEPRQHSAMLDLEEITDWDHYHASLPSSQRKQRNKRRNKLNSMGKLEYRVSQGGSDEYRYLVEKCLAFKKIWLRETGRLPGRLGTPETQRFFQSLNFQEKTRDHDIGAVAHCLYLDEKPVGIELGMLCNNDYYSYLGAIDWDLRKYSPGKVQMEFAQRWAAEKGIRRFDFLNDPSDYKSYWTNSKQDLVSLNIPLTLKGYAYSRVWKTIVRPRLKLFYHKTGAANRELINKASSLLGAGFKS